MLLTPSTGEESAVSRTVLGYPEKIPTNSSANVETKPPYIPYPITGVLAEGRERFRALVQDACGQCGRPFEEDSETRKVREQVQDRIVKDLLKKALSDGRALTGCDDEAELKNRFARVLEHIDDPCEESLQAMDQAMVRYKKNNNRSPFAGI
ncbi:unnamed protein product [Amoebophrya sp. A25]|nr:unnamed protein product [Amoebophrya sp. A25]|eukprot:GSA25T00016223001.1